MLPGKAAGQVHDRGPGAAAGIARGYVEAVARRARARVDLARLGSLGGAGVRDQEQSQSYQAEGQWIQSFARHCTSPFSNSSNNRLGTSRDIQAASRAALAQHPHLPAPACNAELQQIACLQIARVL